VLKAKKNEITDVGEIAAREAPFDDLVTTREKERLVRDALDALSAQQRLAVVLFYFAGENLSSIARFLGVPRSTVVKRLFAARRRLFPVLQVLRVSVGQRRLSDARRMTAMVRAGIYNDYVGSYRFAARPDLTVTLKRVGNRLVGFAGGRKNRVLLGARVAQLRVAEFDGRAQFLRNREGVIDRFIYYEFGKKMGVAKKVPKRPLPR
jgi:hypothetical protein